eukprot:gene12987-biopygen8210
MLRVLKKIGITHRNEWASRLETHAASGAADWKPMLRVRQQTGNPCCEWGSRLETHAASWAADWRHMLRVGQQTGDPCCEWGSSQEARAWRLTIPSLRMYCCDPYLRTQGRCGAVWR